MLRRAVLVWRLTPEAFWALSWREWLWLSAPDTPSRLDRCGLDELIGRFPDGDDER